MYNIDAKGIMITLEIQIKIFIGMYLEFDYYFLKNNSPTKQILLLVSGIISPHN